MMDEETPFHVALYPSPGMGHLIPIIELAKRLLQPQPNKLSFTLIIPSKSPLTQSQDSILKSLPPTISYITVPPINVDDVPRDSNVVMNETRLTISRSLPALRNVLKSISTTKNLVALVVDLLATEAFDVAEELCISKYSFYPSAVLNLSVFLHLNELSKNITCAFKDYPHPIQLPGCMPIRGEDLLRLAHDRKNEIFKWALHLTKKYFLADGMMVNSFEELEPEALRGLRESGIPKVYPIGPLVRNSSKEVSILTDYVQWLNDQPSSSVLYISFGSGGTLSSAQFLEFAIGLELSNQRFMWVVRPPSDVASNRAYLDEQTGDPLRFLPEGFLDRVRGRGFVVKGWAPQAQILPHGSISAFLTHCGWNSTLEAMINGVPLIAWPLHAEQRTNAALLHESLKVAMRPKETEDGLVRSVEVANVVKCLMEGEQGMEVRGRMREVKHAAERATNENGSSTRSLCELSSILSRNFTRNFT